MIFVNTSSRAQAEHDLYLYTSSDGTTFGAAVHLVDSADVPSLTQDSSGRLICVFQNFKGGFGSSAWDKLGVVSSTDNGSIWFLIQPVIPILLFQLTLLIILQNPESGSVS